VIRSGWRSTLVRRLALGAAAVLIPVLAGCEAGNNAPTLQFHYPTDAAGTVVGDISIRNVFVLGAPLGSSLHTGQSASLFLAIVNDGAPDRLQSISAPGSATSVSLPSGGVPVVDGHPVFLSGPRPELVLTDLTRTITGGSTIKLQLTFQKAGLVTLVVPVMARASHYQTYAPPQQSAVTPNPTVTPTPSTTASPSATPDASATPKASKS
jgi:copper(I)-binding protein